MANNQRFVYNPSTINIKRSSWKMPYRHQFDLYHGDVVPVGGITEILPGDTFKCNISSLIRMATPIAPIMDNITMNFAAFYVPKRIVWDKTKQFYGENVEGYGVATAITEPRSTNPSTLAAAGEVNTNNKRSLARYLGLVAQVESSSGATLNEPINLNALRSYYAIYNDWFRNENLQSPYTWSHVQTGDSDSFICMLDGKIINAKNDGHIPATTGSYSLFQCNKKVDMFTSCLPFAQKSASAVLLPLGSTASVSIDSPLYLYGADGAYGTVQNATAITSTGGTSDLIFNSTVSQAGDGIDANTNLKAVMTGSVDLRNATSATINQIRLAFATQRVYEKFARYGSRYREFILGMFNTNIGDTTAQMPEYLGGISFNINIDQVLQTTGYASGSTTTLGSPGAYSLTGSSGALFTKSFAEPGYLIIVGYAKHDRTYGQGLDEIYSKHELFDYYLPTFAHLGEMPILKKRLYLTGDASENAEFGFQEAWSGYRYKRDMCTGFLCPSNNNSLNFWNLADNYSTAPSLNGDWIKEDRNSIARCLSTGVNGPDYLCDVLIDFTVARPMPVNSIPGLIDHF